MDTIGLDVSKYNIGWDPDRAVKPIHFVIQRASWSVYKDEKFDQILPCVAKVPIRGAYHYYSSNVPWKSQADLFLSVTSAKGFHFYVVDYERAYNVLSTRTIAEVSEFVKYVKEKTGKRCMIYFSPDIFKVDIKPYGYANWANQQDVWIAQYPWSPTQVPVVTAPAMPTGLTTWKIWQYGGADIANSAGRLAGPDYGGGLAGIDLNCFNGTVEEMMAWANSTETSAPVPTPTPVPTPLPVPIPSPNPMPETLKFGILKPRYVHAGPAIIAGSDAPQANHPTIALGIPEQAFIKALNNNDAGIWALFVAANVGPTKGMNQNNKMVYIPAGWSGNVVKILEEKNGWTRVDSIDLSKGAPFASDYSHTKTPHLIHKMTTVNINGDYISYPLKNGQISPWDKLMDPLFSENGQFWIPSEWILDFATLNRAVNVRTGPGTTFGVVGGMPGGSKLSISTVAMDGQENFWGSIAPGRWCCLRYYGVMYSDWTLK